MKEVVRYMTRDGRTFKYKHEAVKHDKEIEELYDFYKERFKAIMKHSREEYSFWEEMTNGWAWASCDNRTLIFTPISQLDADMLSALSGHPVDVGTKYIITDVYDDQVYVDDWNNVKNEIKKRLERY